MTNSLNIGSSSYPFVMVLTVNFEHQRQQSAYCGEFLASFERSRDIKLSLFDDGTFILEGEECNGRIVGTWAHQNGDTGDYIDFSPPKDTWARQPLQ